jgi:hypothetical protein
MAMGKLLIHAWLRIWANAVCPCFFGIGMGPSKQEYAEYGAEANIGNFGASTGEGDVLAASGFWKDILSGDPTKLSKALGPEYSNINKRAGEEEKTLAAFGTRSGGTAAEAATIGDRSRATASKLEGGMLETSAGALGSMGDSLLGIGAEAHNAAFSMAKTIHDQKQAKLHDIFKSISSVASSVATMGFGGAAGAAFGGMSSGQISSAFGGPSEAPTTTSNASSDFIQ